MDHHPSLLIAGGSSSPQSGSAPTASNSLLPATLEARNIEVGSKVGGRILRVLAQEGDLVQPNQLLVSSTLTSWKDASSRPVDITPPPKPTMKSCFAEIARRKSGKRVR